MSEPKQKQRQRGKVRKGHRPSAGTRASVPARKPVRRRGRASARVAISVPSPQDELQREIDERGKLPILAKWSRVPTTPDELKRAAIYLEVLEHSKVVVALGVSGLRWRCVSDWMASDTAKDGFAEKCANALRVREELRQMIREDEIHRRGVEGWEEPVHHLGVPVSSVRRYSDGLLTLAAKAGSSKYSERHEVSGPAGGAIIVESRVPEPDPPKSGE